MLGCDEEGSGSLKSANERFEGIGRGDFDSVEEMPDILRRVTIYKVESNTRGAAV